jgi:hypothetical protein
LSILAYPPTAIRVTLRVICTLFGEFYPASTFLDFGGLGAYFLVGNSFMPAKILAHQIAMPPTKTIVIVIAIPITAYRLHDGRPLISNRQLRHGRHGSR